ncbi:MAG: class I SAM-dependent methyltransferase [Geminicoccaceae bacterium]
MSDGFSPDWLDLREPFDTAARDAALLDRLASWRRDRGQLHVTDLGAGTGGNLRRTATRLGGAQRWALVERDPALIRAGQARLGGEAVEWRYRQLDLATELEALGDEPCDLVTASALLDLVSREWLARLVALCRCSGAALYITLTYDGRIEWDPEDPCDAPAVRLVNQHQRTDKGFGPACGPEAVAELAMLLGRDTVELASSDWVLKPEASALQSELMRGYLHAALAMAPDAALELDLWADRRRSRIAEDDSCLRVGHTDLLLLPA